IRPDQSFASDLTITLRGHDRQRTTDSVEKVGFSDHLNSGTATTGEPTHHIEWFLGPSLTFVDLCCFVIGLI
ncbi:hypothetical protein, partial [Pseudomonas sp. P5_C3]